ncbi:hypothetical protein SAMN04488077_10310 [Roseovarius tolerans]|uniref:Uncharacterized protein n=1 Tax=Roseovarius tolerans TaxID=74031 RepID=A0A1H7WIW0_9RHOB|nr:hypothetical protein SAMN04488077_10310 [Roseovarius tolerans]
MFATLMVNAYSQVQGLIVEAHEDGQVSVNVGDRIFKGWPVSRPENAAQYDRKPEPEHA